MANHSFVHGDRSCLCTPKPNKQGCQKVSFVDRTISVQEAFSGINACRKSNLFMLLMYIALNLN